MLQCWNDKDSLAETNYGQEATYVYLIKIPFEINTLTDLNSKK